MATMPSRCARPALIASLLLGLAPAACRDDDASADGGTCASTGPCLASHLDLDTGTCTISALADGTACDDDNVCTQTDFCLQGSCAGSRPLYCGTVDSCGLPGACDPVGGCAAAGSTPCIAAPTALALQGCAFSSYTVQAQVGTGAPLALLLDSGSSTLAVASSLCSGCGVAPTYTAGAGATGQTSQAQYVDSSAWTGSVYADTVSLGAGAQVTMDLVAMRTQSQFFTPDVCVGDVQGSCNYQGIIGMGAAALTAPHTDAFMDKLAAAGSTGFVFTTQLCDAGGNLWLGGYDPNAVAATPQWTPMTLPLGFYTIAFADMALGGTSLGYGTDVYGGVVVDTGTSAFVLPQQVYDTVTQKLEADPTFAAAFGAGFFSSGSCSPPASGLARAALDQHLPALSLALPQAGGTGSFTVDLPPTESYLASSRLQDGTQVYCPAIAPGTGTTLGAAGLRSLVTIFAVQAYQLGLAPQHGCAP